MILNALIRKVTTQMQQIGGGGPELLEWSFYRFHRPESQLLFPHTRVRANHWNLRLGTLLSKLFPVRRIERCYKHRAHNFSNACMLKKEETGRSLLSE